MLYSNNKNKLCEIHMRLCDILFDIMAVEFFLYSYVATEATSNSIFVAQDT